MKTRRGDFLNASALQMALCLALASFSVSLFAGAFAAASVGKPESAVRRFAKLTPDLASVPQPRALSVADRIAYQRRVEEVYWRHRIWPRSGGENSDPKPPLDAAVSRSQVERKVNDYLRNSQALENDGQPIRPEELQAEMERMALETRQPAVLHELFAALGNDPFIIAECLVRPALSNRIVTKLGATAQSGRTKTMVASAVDYKLPAIRENVTMEGASVTVGGSTCPDDTWASTSVTNAPSARAEHTAIWTGSEMIVWGGQFFGELPQAGGRYNPATDTWTATSTVNAPTGRSNHTAVWNGSEMIVWGGYTDIFHGIATATGGRYNPVTDTWTPTNGVGAPDPRAFAAAVWTGSEMIVWGGYAYTNTGGRYNPVTDSWVATNTVGAPAPRSWNTAVWTGSEMIIWGGRLPNFQYANTGGKYNPATDSWTATSTVGAPEPRYSHTAVLLGGKMIIWGGCCLFDTGGVYDPNTDSWMATSTSNAPSPRYDHTAIATNAEMIIWGGLASAGGRYNPNTDSWTSTSMSDAPELRFLNTAVWTGNEMIVWGGVQPTPTSAPIPVERPVAVDPLGSFFNSGGRYCTGPVPTPTITPTPIATPTPTPITPAPTGTPTPATHAFNLSTRLFADTDDNVGIGGFIITGIEPKQLVLRGIGPSLVASGLTDPLADPVLELHGPAGFTTVINDNWMDSGIPIPPEYQPGSELESVILLTLDPGAYTVILKGNGNGTGIGLVEIFDLSGQSNSRLANLSTRAFVGTANNIVIAGFILGHGVSDDRIGVRGLGPSLSGSGISNALVDPTLELRNSDGMVIASNDNWQDGPPVTLPPANPLESAIEVSLSPGAYTALLSGMNNGTGVGLVEVYDNIQGGGLQRVQASVFDLKPGSDRSAGFDLLNRRLRCRLRAE